MSKRKKKPNRQAQRHLANQYRVDFFMKMQRLICLVCGKDVYDLIPPQIIANAYLSRCAPFKYQADPGCNFSAKQLNDAKVILSHLFKEAMIRYPKYKLEISVDDFFTVVLTIVVMHTRITDTMFENAPKVKEALLHFGNEMANNVEVNVSLNKILLAYAIGDSDLTNVLYWYKHEFAIPQTFPGEVKNFITVRSVTPESFMIEIDGITRPAIRVGWAYPHLGPQWLSIKSSELGYKNSFAEIPLDVYIQSHAINRLKERIDCFLPGSIHYGMYTSLREPVIARDNNNKLLIEFRIIGTKAGYFRADIVNGVILIRTFLFITNNGTPEGQLLEKNTGLQKLDKKYLAIDKLSTFMSSDIEKNEDVRRIFKAAGCHCILELYEKIKPLVTSHTNALDPYLILKYIANQSVLSDIKDIEVLETLVS